MDGIQKAVAGLNISGGNDWDRYVSLRKQTCDPTSGTSDDIIACFPLRHSCDYCQEKIINALRAEQYAPAFLCSIDDAVKAARQGCSLYE